MTTSTWVTAVSHTTDAEFRAWGSELSGKLSVAGLVQTSDTGQINWTTVSRPGTNTAGGYEIWKFNDSLAATAPIYLKIEYGTGANAAYPQIWLTVGTGSNGSGTLTGATTSRNTVTYSGVVTSGNWASYLCVAAGFVGLCWKSGAAAGTVGYAFFVIARTNDASGSATSTGFIVYWGAASSSSACQSQSVRAATTATAYSATTLNSIVPGQVTDSLVGTDLQVYAHFGISPQVWTLATLATVLLSEVPPGATVSVAMVGSTARTLLSIGAGYRPLAIGTGPGIISTYGFAMLWE